LKIKKFIVLYYYKNKIVELIRLRKVYCDLSQRLYAV